jgi:hypothetical protein
MQARLAATLATLRAEDARIGKNVTREAQDIFDALERTLPTRWDGVNIIVSDAVMIVPPYRSEDCKAGTGAATQSLGRVKIVVSGPCPDASFRRRWAEAHRGKAAG